MPWSTDLRLGHLLERGTEAHEQARGVCNAMIDKRPTLIARCANADDVRR
jgi:hypothetical protein